MPNSDENVTAEVISELPEWLGELRASGIGVDERLIRITSGECAGEFAIVCWTDPPSDPESDEAQVAVVYTESDWAHDAAPSLGFDDDGDLVWFTADGSYGSEPVSYARITVSA